MLSLLPGDPWKATWPKLLIDGPQPRCVKPSLVLATTSNLYPDIVPCTPMLTTGSRTAPCSSTTLYLNVSTTSLPLAIRFCSAVDDVGSYSKLPSGWTVTCAP